MSKGAPPADPNIGKAAMLSAETGQDYLAWMRDQAAITNQWAKEDRAREIGVFRPMEDRLIAEAKTWDSPERQASEAARARADTQLALAQGEGQMRRDAMRMGVNPASGRFAEARRRAGTDAALAVAGADNLARRRVQQEGEAKRAGIVNLGRGLAVNPGTSIGLSNGAASSGFSGAMQGYGQQGQLLNEQQNYRMQAWQANQGIMGDIFGGIGKIAGAMFFGSSKEIKENKKPTRDLAGAIKRLKVEKWDYKPGEGDGGSHVGPYAEDWQRETGLGDGKTINVIDAVGVTVGAVKEIAQKVDKMERRIRRIAA